MYLASSDNSTNLINSAIWLFDSPSVVPILLLSWPISVMNYTLIGALKLDMFLLHTSSSQDGPRSPYRINLNHVRSLRSSTLLGRDTRDVRAIGDTNDYTIVRCLTVDCVYQRAHARREYPHARVSNLRATNDILSMNGKTNRQLFNYQKMNSFHSCM